LLLVEDDTMIGEVVLDLLRAEHFAVDWVRDGDMADTALRSQHYDLVLLDLGLPRRDGLEVLQALRARKDNTPVLIVTARDAVQDRDRRAGCRRRRLRAQALRPARTAGPHSGAGAAQQRAGRAGAGDPRPAPEPGHARGHCACRPMAPSEPNRSACRRANGPCWRY
jgi:CheY-like chemotaxis protein